MPVVRNVGEIRKARERLDRAIVGVVVSLVGVLTSMVIVTL